MAGLGSLVARRRAAAVVAPVMESAAGRPVSEPVPRPMPELVPELVPGPERSVVVAVHDSASDGGQWRGLAGHLAPHFDLNAPDLPGYGHVACRGDVVGPRGVPADARTLLGLIRRIGQPVHLVGHGYGAAVVLRAALERPGVVLSLTLVSPAAYHLLRGEGPAERRLFGGVMDVVASMAVAAAGGDRTGAVARFVDLWQGPGAWARSGAGGRTRLVGELDRVLDDLASLASERGRLTELAGIGCPALAIVGLEAPAATVRVAELVAEALPSGVLRRLPRVGHMAPLTDPHLVGPMIAAHLLAAERGRLSAAA